MKRATGHYQVTNTGDESVREFPPHSLAPSLPAFELEGELATGYGKAIAAVARKEVARTMAPDVDLFLYRFVRKEAVITSQIEGTQGHGGKSRSDQEAKKHVHG